MNLTKGLIYKLSLCFILINPFFLINKVQSADQIKITYSIFSRTISIKSLKKFSLSGRAEKKLERLLRTTNASNESILNILNKNYDIPLPLSLIHI